MVEGVRAKRGEVSTVVCPHSAGVRDTVRQRHSFAAYVDVMVNSISLYQAANHETREQERAVYTTR